MKCILISDIYDEPANGGDLARQLPEDTQLHQFSLAKLVGKPEWSGERLHDHLVNRGGTELAVQRLLEQHKSVDIAIGFSAGGTVLWRACLAGLACADLFCLASTRLRNETAKPPGRTHVFFDQKDIDSSSQTRLRRLSDSFHVFRDGRHTAYLNPDSGMNRLAGQLLRKALVENVSTVSVKTKNSWRPNV